MEGFLAAALLLTWREGFEAAAIVALILAYLRRTGRADHFGQVALAVAAAGAACTIAGTAIFLAAGRFEGRPEEIFEGVVGIVAAVVVTHVWRQGVNYRRRVEAATEKALAAERVGVAIFVAVFVAVAIEGMEIVLFLLATVRDTAGNLVVGGAAGLLLAVACGWIFYQTNKLRDAVLFFYALSALLIVIAAGLLAHGIHELQEASLFPVVREHIWNLNGVPALGENAGLGAFLKSTIGYNADPELLEFVAWAGYLVVAGWYFNAIGFFRTLMRTLTAPRDPAARSAS